MKPNVSRILRWGFWFFVAHTIVASFLLFLRVAGGELLGRAAEQLVHAIDYPLSSVLQSHDAQLKIIGPVYNWLETYFPTPLLAVAIVFVAIGGATYFLVGCLVGWFLVRRAHRRRIESD